MNNYIYHKNKDLKINGLNISVCEAEELVYYFLNGVFKKYNIDVHIHTVYAHGSRIYGGSHNDSDLDFVVFYIGNFKEDSLFNVLYDEDYYIDDVRCDFNPIQLNNHIRLSYEKQIIKYISEHDNVLREDAAYALSDSDNQTSGFSYEIKPLNTNLSQAGNDTEMLNKNKAFKFFPGDMVKGYCPFDKKYHEGMIKYLYYTTENEKIPKYVYIQDFDNEDTIPVLPKDLHLSRHISDLQFRTMPGPYDYFQYRPVLEKIEKAINNGLKKSLDIDNLENIAVNFKRSKLQNKPFQFLQYLIDEFIDNPSLKLYENIKKFCFDNKYTYKVKDFLEFNNLFEKILKITNDIDLSWIDTVNALTFIMKDKSELSLNQLNNKNDILFIKFNNYKWIDHPLIIHKNLKIGKEIWCDWKYQLESAPFTDNMYNGYENTYGGHGVISYKLNNTTDYPAFIYCVNQSINEYKGYFPALGELLFFSENINLVNYILKYISNVSLNINSGCWSSSTEDYSNKAHIWALCDGEENPSCNKHSTYSILPLFKNINQDNDI